MAIAKVILNGVTQMDVTDKTVTAGSMLSGATALKNDGTDITGSIESKTSSDLTASGATVTAPAGYYASAASKSVASGSAATPATTITANPTVSVNSSGLITASVSKTQNVTPTVSAGYVSSGTAGTITVSGSGTSQLTTQAAQTIHPSTTDQTIASGKYLTGAQTIKAVTTTNLTAENIVQGVTVKVGDSTDDDCVASVTGTAETGGGNDFVITLTKNASTGIWEPDCTYAEAQAAYNGGENVAFEASLDGSPIPCGEDSRSSNIINYFVFEPVVTSNDFVFNYIGYEWDSTGIYALDDPYPYYDTNSATAVPADVASGKVFYNADGYQVGTASGGGGSDVDLKGIVERTVTSLTLPDNLTKIGDYAFAGCTSLATMNIPSGITSIGTYAFYNCQALSISQIPSGVTSIGQNGFYNCYGLAATSLPSGLTRIEAYAFYGCRNLAITSLPSGLTALGNYAFFGCYNIAVTEIPSGVTSIGDYAFNACINITSISTSAAITSLGSGVFLSNSGGNAGYGMKLAHASFPNMVINNISTVFGSTMVERACQLLEDADIGGTKVISANAFANCYKLQTLILRKSDAICTLSNVSAFLNTPMRGYNDLTGTIYVPSALISTYQTATNWSTIYGEGYVTFAAIEGSEYEL